MTWVTRSFLIVACVFFAACGGSGGGGGNGGGQANLSLSQTAISFGSSQGASNPAPINVNVSNTGSGNLSFTAASDSPWLSATPSNGSAPTSIQVSVTVGTLAVNTYTGHITVTSSGAQGSPATITVTFIVASTPSNSPTWGQWGAGPEHQGSVGVAGQAATTQLADIVYDPFVSEEQTESGGGELTVHYQVPLTDGNDVYMLIKTGQYQPCSPHGAWQNGADCGPNEWNWEVWGEARFSWINGTLTEVWDYTSDWKPEPNGSGLDGWEPVFHPVEANGFIYVPGAGGTVWKVNKADGSAAGKINPFANTNVTASDTYVAGPLSVDASGNVYYNAIELADPSVGDPWENDIQGAWLVKITPTDVASTLSFASLIPNAPAGTATSCPGQFGSNNPLPWPPSANAVPPTVLCGSQRAGLNIAPAIGVDGTIFTASRAHFDGMESYLIAVKSDFSGAKWVASMQQLLNDGCGTIESIGPTNSSPDACRVGTTPGVDPTTNAPGSANIFDLGSSSPTVLPDGSVVFGAITNYNGFRGHLFKFDANGNFTGAYPFGWDSTPAVYSHNGTYSIVIKDNHYPTGLYCNGSSAACQAAADGPYYITQLDPNLNIEWQFQSTNTQSCTRQSNGSLKCSTTNPNGFEWCINMPAVDANGNVYVTSEDGNLYVLPQGNTGVFTTPASSIFLNLAIGAAYTPLSLGADGKIYTQNDGHLFVVGN
jgi:Viral BACON domain